MRHPTPSPWFPLLLLLLLVGCGQGDSLPLNRGMVSGTLRVDQENELSQGVALRTDRQRPHLPPLAEDDFVPGEVIVGFHPGVQGASAQTLQVAGARLALVRPIALANAALYRTEGADAATTLAFAASLEQRPEVAFAHPNYLLQPLAVIPNDPSYPRQWHYDAIRLPEAWAITTGALETVVAVLDTGILHSQSQPWRTHPELVGKVLPGYDFVSNPFNAGDGNGRDADPYEVYPLAHGTHVAGTIAARSNNGIGVAGIDWNAKILPVRVLGMQGGTLLDIIEGLLWAAGFPVLGVANNPHPAHVINMSLGGNRPCPLLLQLALNRVANASPRQAVVVAAAGNEAIDAWLSMPANCANVIAVGATDYEGRRASYSNYGTRIDVMAPGGMTRSNVSGFGNDGVYSLGFGTTANTFGYRRSSGTSMAAPHVAGVVALMKGLTPGLTVTEVRNLLEMTSKPLPEGACQTDTLYACGFGLLDAAAALEAVRDGVIPSSRGRLVFETPQVSFGREERLDVTLRNIGSAPLQWSTTTFIPAEGNPGAMADEALRISRTSGSLGVNGTVNLTLSVDRSKISGEGAFAFAVVFRVDGDEAGVLLQGSLLKASLARATLQGPLLVGAFQLNLLGQPVASGSAFFDTFVPEFSFPVKTGANWLLAWADENESGELDVGDYLALTSRAAVVLPRGEVSGLELVLAPHVATDPVMEGWPPGFDLAAAVRALQLDLSDR
jgi:serine protease